MALAHVNNDASAQGGAKPSLAVVYPNNVTAGNLLVLGVWLESQSAAIASITDTRGNNYQLDRTQDIAATSRARLYSCISVGSGPNTITVTHNQGGSIQMSLQAMEFSGVTSTAWLDAVESDSATSNSLDSGVGQAIAQADEVLIGSGSSGSAGGNTWTADASYTLTTAANVSDSAMEWRIVSAAGTYDATMTQTSGSGWAMILATYKAPGGGVVSTIRPLVVSSQPVIIGSGPYALPSGFDPGT